MRFLPFAGLCGLLLLTGCHSAYMEATVQNASAQPISLVEVDYPSASFGTQTLVPGQDFHYRFKVLGQGALKLIYTDAARKEQHSEGPVLDEGDEGVLEVTVSPAGVQWGRKLKNRP